MPGHRLKPSHLRQSASVSFRFLILHPRPPRGERGKRDQQTTKHNQRPLFLDRGNGMKILGSSWLTFSTYALFGSPPKVNLFQLGVAWAGKKEGTESRQCSPCIPCNIKTIYLPGYYGDLGFRTLNTIFVKYYYLKITA